MHCLINRLTLAMSFGSTAEYLAHTFDLASIPHPDTQGYSENGGFTGSAAVLPRWLNLMVHKR